ncbi:pectinesterase family protein [Rivibacter subsaxonicus]|uniref:Pectin methylesterase-like acyl-CoA thioesterase n=1 Tax=Rivibacter subsaxonicus TaxID=457575 RepID=A0A4Q7VB81_9BURK|nr:pectinesterase family protein [Rivibacter subsaxonicus]RZT91958.1 pectin methylesterase-like acyl-CoA thioesterase [Rivibacter subsaxonicus]
MNVRGRRCIAAGALLLACTAVLHAQPRPQLEDADAARHTIEQYLGAGPAPWVPEPMGDPGQWKPQFVVATDGSGTHRSVQAALDALPARVSGAPRHYIRIEPGTYREQLCVRDKVPFTLYGGGSEPAQVRIVAGHYNAEPRPRRGVAGSCVADPHADTFGTAGSASVTIVGDAVQVANLSIVNDAMDRVRAGQGYPAGAGESGGAQAVALLTRGDRLQLENLRLLGHQDTFYAARERADAPARVLVRHSLIAGDVDFVFGDATLVIDDSLLLSRAGRRAAGQGGHVLAPSTPAAQSHGFLVQRSRLLAEPGVAVGSVSLGRAWDHGVAAGAWQPALSPNGQALVRDSLLGEHLRSWAASTSRRPFASTGAQANRMAEYRNALLPPAARQTLPEGDGWGSVAGGTSGGADASAEQVLVVRDPRELRAAMALGDRPKIVLVQGRIALGRDEQGRAVGYEALRDPEFDFEAFVRTYDPASWGRRAPQGPQEEARRRSARRQAAQVVLRVPSNTTLLGFGPGAGIDGGMLLLERVQNVIVRNLLISDPHDLFPAWDPLDNGHGEWNSDYDAVSLRGARRVWIDHCSFNDDEPASRQPDVALGRPIQRHDGLLDITQQSDLVTVSWNHFRRHDKTTLVGGSDAHTLDAGQLRVSFHHNLWEELRERTPRVRYGQVHVYNNLFVGRSDSPHPFGYSIGLGYRSAVLSEHNAWELSPDIGAERLVRLLRGEVFEDRGSLLNGQPVDLLATLRAAHPQQQLHGAVDWTPPYRAALDAAQDVPARVRAGAGSGML